MNERTLAKSISFSGIGLHTGKPIYVDLQPASIGTGIVFYKDNSVISAIYNNVRSTMMSTNIGVNGTTINTVEHLLSALWGLEIDNVRIHVKGEEIPIMDGSSRPFVDMILHAGIEEQALPKNTIILKEILELKFGDKHIVVSPSSHFSVSAKIPFIHDSISNQMFSYTQTPENYMSQIAPARTFGFVNEIAMLNQKGLALGASLDCAIGIDDDLGVVNERGLRWESEFVRHKILDIIGDFSLLGFPLQATITANKTGHRQHIEMIKKIYETKDAWELKY